MAKILTFWNFQNLQFSQDYQNKNIPQNLTKIFLPLVAGETVQSWYSSTPQRPFSTENTLSFDDLLKEDKFEIYPPTTLMSENHFYNESRTFEKNKKLAENREIMLNAEPFIHTIGK